jgi:hypothetical protein
MDIVLCRPARGILGKRPNFYCGAIWQNGYFFFRTPHDDQSEQGISGNGQGRPACNRRAAKERGLTGAQVERAAWARWEETRQRRRQTVAGPIARATGFDR